MKKRWLIILMCIILTLLSGCGSFSRSVKNDWEGDGSSAMPTGESESTSKEENTSKDADVKGYKTKDLTPEQKVGQLFILRPDSLDPSLSAAQIDDPDTPGVVSMTTAVKDSIKSYYVGGVCLFSKNIQNPDQLKKFTEELQSESDIPMFITVDEEGGIVARLANNSSFGLPKYKSAASVGASGDTDDAYEMGKTIGGYLKDYGFNMDFAPDADVNTNPNNPVIGTRAFSSDAKVAASMVSAAADGFRESGILPTLKHFPGHGDTAEDSHTALAVTNKTLKELQNCEFLPFKSDDGMHCVMVGHIAAPKITGTYVPSSLSEEIINMIPDKENTLIVTDSLAMQAITDTYTSAEAAVLAFEAGCDLLLMPVDFKAAYNGVLQAVKSGRISEKRLDESIDKIMRFKNRFVY